MLKLNLAESGPIFIEVKKAFLRIGEREQKLNKILVHFAGVVSHLKNHFAMALINLVNLVVICV